MAQLMKLPNAWRLIGVKILIVLAIIVISTSLYDGLDNTFIQSNTTIHKARVLKQQSQNIPIYLVMCKGTHQKKTSQQVRQAITLLKSAAALTKVILKFNIFADSDTLYNEVIYSLKNWPEEYQHRLQVDFHPIVYPTEMKESDIKYTLRKHPCGSYRLLFPDMFPDIDAVLYVDTDTIFMQPPENLFKEFDNFNKEEAAAIAEDRAYSKNKFAFPFPGPSGLNSGIMLMNFTRLRSAPGGGFTTQVTKNLLQQYKDKLKFGDQDLINIYFALNPTLLHKLGCDWNYRVSFCKTGVNTCPEAEQNGASLMHGITETFTKEGVFKDLFIAWEEYDLNTPIQSLVTKLKEELENHASQNGFCLRTKSITYLITKQLSLYID